MMKSAVSLICIVKASNKPNELPETHAFLSYGDKRLKDREV
jgi:hypothetical protein